ncbi:MAG: DMT family transporter [Elusimicrobia bacterium]|nr:DMT family transporter [Elusimicrobiota bacterium]
MSARAWVYLLSSNILAGSAYVAMTYVLRGFSPQAAVFWRLALGAIFMAPSMAKAWPADGIERADWLKIAAVAIFGLALPTSLGTIGLRHSTATNGSLLLGLEPGFIVVLSALLFGEALTVWKIVSVLMGLAGSALIVLQGLPWAARISPHWKGDVFFLASAVLWAIYSILGKSAMKKVPAGLFTGLTTAIAVIPTALAAGSTILPAAMPPPEAFGGLAYQAFGLTILATLLWNKGLELVPASTMARFIFIQPLSGALLGVALTGDPFSGWSAAGGALIVLGLIVGSN